MMKFLDIKEIQDRKENYKVDIDVLKIINEMNTRLSFKEQTFEEKYFNIFIFGLQRSGTTLLTQLLVKYTDLGYINNLIARFWENPKYGIALSKALGLFNKKNITLYSEFGNTYELENIHEFGYFWASLLNQKQQPDLSKKNIEEIDWDLLKNKVLSINYAFNCHCVFKNTLIGHYASHLNKIFNKAIFIYIKRDLIDVVISNLKVREQRYGDIRHWWSMKPKEYFKIKDLDPYEQVVAQLYYLEKDIAKEIKYIPEEKLIFINYEDLIKDTRLIFELLKEKMNQYKVNLQHYFIKENLQYPVIEKKYDIDKIKFFIKKYFKDKRII